MAELFHRSNCKYVAGNEGDFCTKCGSPHYQTHPQVEAELVPMKHLVLLEAALKSERLDNLAMKRQVAAFREALAPFVGGT